MSKNKKKVMTAQEIRSMPFPTSPKVPPPVFKQKQEEPKVPSLQEEAKAKALQSVKEFCLFEVADLRRHWEMLQIEAEYSRETYNMVVDLPSLPSEIVEIFSTYEDWESFPTYALFHATQKSGRPSIKWARRHIEKFEEVLEVYIYRHFHASVDDHLRVPLGELVSFEVKTEKKARKPKMKKSYNVHIPFAEKDAAPFPVARYFVEHLDTDLKSTSAADSVFTKNQKKKAKKDKKNEEVTS